MPGAAIFGQDMLFDLPYIADWNAIGLRQQQIANHTNASEHRGRVDYDYVVGQKVMLTNNGTKLRKAQDRYLGLFTITQVHTNGTIRI